MADTLPPTASPSTASVLLDVARAIAGGLRSVHWSLRFSRLFHLLAFPFRLILIPLSVIIRILLALLAPAIHVASGTYSAFRALGALIASLEPLYTFVSAAHRRRHQDSVVIALNNYPQLPPPLYVQTIDASRTSQFGAAAGVGIFAGILVALSSSLITGSLGMQDDNDDMGTERPSSRHSYSHESQGWHDPSGEFDWQWLDSPTHRRRPATGLLSQTIHEEDDSED